MNIAKLFISFIICFVVAYAGSLVTIPSIGGWYTTLYKPFFTPPNNLFGPVWTVLYLLMAIALAIVWSNKKRGKRALPFFFLQLGLNFVWSAVFFGLHMPFAALLVIVLLWIAIYQSITLFLPISRKAAYLLIPYILWVSFAAILNLAIVVLNF